MLERKLKALADPQRRRLLELLARADHSVADLVTAIELSPATVSHHLQVLREAGLAGMRREGRHRDYFLLPGGSAELLQWLGTLRQLRSQPEWNREAYREQVLSQFLAHEFGALPQHPRKRQVVLDWFHSMLDRDRLISLEELEGLWGPLCKEWRPLLEELIRQGRLVRRGLYILVSD